MERTYNFTIGQKVKTKDEDDGHIIFGEVTDKSRDSVFIKWEDLSEPTEHFQSEYEKIQLR